MELSVPPAHLCSTKDNAGAILQFCNPDKLDSRVQGFIY